MIRHFLTAVLAATAISSSAYTTTSSPALRVWAEMPVFIADGTTVNYITVYQHDDEDLVYTAFNMEFNLPEGFTVNKVKEGRNMVNDIRLSERAAATHTIACNMPTVTNLRIISDSSMNDDFFGDDERGNPLDKLFTIGLLVDPSVASGEYEISNFGIKFVMKNGDATVPAVEPILYTVKVENPTSGLETVSAESLDPDNCYDLAGRKVDPTKAHGIIVSNGRKVMLK